MQDLQLIIYLRLRASLIGNMHPNELTVLEAIDALKLGKVSSVKLVTACFDQIEKHDKTIKAFLALAKDSALEQAKKADETLAKLGATAFEDFPLLGIPYACKDNYSTVGLETTASSNILKGYIPPY